MKICIVAVRSRLGFGLSYGEALKVPFRVKDVLPVLPRQISWPVFNNFHSAVDLLPPFVGSVSPTNGSLEWKGACFLGNEALLEFTTGSRGLGGGVLYLKRVIGGHCNTELMSQDLGLCGTSVATESDRNVSLIRYWYKGFSKKFALAFKVLYGIPKL
ncbi:hypothetical protein Vadar_011784 [Vaccinium darrowii]|uniref:Uncharacterized protein n=1 Tax=Vaccinium darrowii TaxID=229202 RepID=A0ACB7XYD4_9ERIC|nr:hypothetical protein Vadar_011784 [Vaccinium darrowii]